MANAGCYELTDIQYPLTYPSAHTAFMLAQDVFFFGGGQAGMMDFHVHSPKSRMDILQNCLFFVDIFLGKPLEPWKAHLWPFGFNYHFKQPSSQDLT